MISTVKVGDQFPDVAHRSDLLPVGSCISTARSRGERYDQVAPRVWTDRGKTMIDSYYLSTPLFVQQMGERTEVVLPPESASNFRWRLRDTALGAGERSGVALGAIQRMCAEFGADTPLFTVGGVVTSRTDIVRLPVGSVIYVGHPDLPKLLNVWEITDGGQMSHRLGPAAGLRTGMPVTIHSIPGYLRPPEEEPASEEALARIALRAFRIGKVYQSKQNWCSVFNRCLDGLGINDAMLTSIGAVMSGPGDELRKEQVAGLPEGSVLWHRWRGDQGFAVYVRDDGARGRSKTRRLFGYGDDGSNTHDLMTVVSTPQEPMAWSVTGQQALHFPLGTVLRGVQQFTLTEESRGTLLTWHTYTVLSVPL